MKSIFLKKLSIKKVNLKQVLILFGSNILLIIIGFAIKKIQTNELGEIDYGEYAFFVTLVSFLVLFFRFGFFATIQNLLAQNYNSLRSKKILGIGFIIALINGLALSFSLWVLSFFINDWFNTSIGQTIRNFAPLTLIFPFKFLPYTGTNKKYGIRYYKSAIFNQTTYKLDGLLLSAFYSTTLLGFYSLVLLVPHL